MNMLKMILLIVLGGGLFGGQVVAAGLYDGYALADGVVTEVEVPEGVDNVSGNKFCTIHYEVSLGGKVYEGQGNGISDFCYLGVGDEVKIKYLERDVRDHAVATQFEVEEMGVGGEVGVDFFVVFQWVALGMTGVVVLLMVSGVVWNLRQRKRVDQDGDGLLGDDKPATVEQKKLIQDGFRRLGVRHEVKKGLTQAQARETLREIERKLKRR